MIKKSLADLGYTFKEAGSIEFLSCDLQVIISLKYIIYYSLGLALACLAFIPIRSRLAYIFKNKVLLLLFLAAVVMTLTIMAITVDWGRDICWNLIPLFLLTLIKQDDNKTEENLEKSKLYHVNGKKLVIACIAYLTLWNMSALDPEDRMFIPMAAAKLIIHMDDLDAYYKPVVGKNICEQTNYLPFK